MVGGYIIHILFWYGCLVYTFIKIMGPWGPDKFEPWHDKTNKVSVRPAKTQISLGIRPVWSESLLSAWRNIGALATHWAHSKDSDQTGSFVEPTSPIWLILELPW